MLFHFLSLVALYLTTVLSVPVGQPTTPNNLTPRAQDPTSILLTIAPTSSTCDGASFPAECLTASAAVSAFLSSFAQYSIATAPEQAALLAWTAYESLEWKVQHNLFPGTPGQGTNTMMMPPFVAEYVASIRSITSKAAGLTDPTAILALVTGANNADLSLGSAAWFYSTKCNNGVKTALRTGSQSGWEGFLTGCVGTIADEGTGSTSRLAYWQRATAALSVG